MVILLVTVCLALLTPSWVTAAYCPPDNGMTDEVRAVFVYQHNHYRSLAARGLLKNKLGGYVPKAARMKKVGYDCEVEKNMMEYAKKCIVKHNPEADRNYWGQNLWATGARNMSKTHAAESAVAGWISEVWTHGFPKNYIFSEEAWRMAGHFSEVVWQESDKIGCAVVWCPGMTFVGCEYNPGGNRPGYAPYEIGDPCTTDADCQCKGCVCSRDEALCIPPGYVPLHTVPTTTTTTTTTKKPTTTTTTPTTTTTKPLYVGGSPDIKSTASCPGNNNGMTDEVREMFLNRHNNYRSLIASGRAMNKLGGFAPKAARMMKMSYDCDVETNVVEWAGTCMFGYNSVAQKNRWGTNMHSLSFTPNKTKAAAEGVDAWFSELYNIGVPQDNTFTNEFFTRGTTEYSQLAWQTSNKIGCAVVSCWNAWTAVACEYNPGGLKLSHTIYDIGEPCTTNEDCQCVGCVCSRDEALCIAP
uniref:SCP-like protein n=1 Tax=Haemonchus contortus TaxID=6289 RepID=A0A7I4YT47_HAECO